MTRKLKYFLTGASTVLLLAFLTAAGPVGGTHTDEIQVGRTDKSGTKIKRIRFGTTAAMTAGSITVNDAFVTANSNIQLTALAQGGTAGSLRVQSRVPGTSFTITSTSGTDTSTVAWLMIEPSGTAP